MGLSKLPVEGGVRLGIRYTRRIEALAAQRGAS